jgi:hypothetical protein
MQGSDWVDGIIRIRIAKDKLDPYLQVPPKVIDWATIEQQLTNQYPLDAERVVAETKPEYYFNHALYPEYERASIAFLIKFFRELDDYDINERAWDLFEITTDSAMLRQIADISKKLIDREKAMGTLNANYIDTYSNILYKMGNTGDAIKWETAALEIAKGQSDQIIALNSTLTKMKKGEKTWN